MRSDQAPQPRSSVGFDFTHTDDTVLLVDDARFISNLSNVHRTLSRPFFRGSSRGEGYYRPLVTSSFIVDAQWNGTKPAVFHATNVVVHFVATCLLFFFLVELRFGYVLSLIGALVFSVNPAIAEAVYWIPGRCDLLLGVGFLLSGLCFLRYLRRGGTGPLLGHLVGLAIALLSKEAGLMIPVVGVAYVLIAERRPPALRDPRLWAGWAVLLLGWYAMWSSAGALAASETPSQRLATVWSNLPVILVHLGKTVVPYGLSVLANRQDARLIVGSLVLFAGLASVAWLSGHARRVFIWGALVFFLFLLPTLAVSDFLILENRLYIPTIGVLISCCALIQAVLDRTPWARRGLLAFGAAILIAFALHTWHYGESFRNAGSFTAQAVKSSPHLALSHLNRGIVLHREGHVQEAETEYRTALSLDPQQPVTQNSLGLILMERGELGEAEVVLRREIAVKACERVPALFHSDQPVFGIPLDAEMRALGGQGKVLSGTCRVLASARPPKALAFRQVDTYAGLHVERIEHFLTQPEACPPAREHLPRDAGVTIARLRPRPPYSPPRSTQGSRRRQGLGLAGGGALGPRPEEAGRARAQLRDAPRPA